MSQAKKAKSILHSLKHFKDSTAGQSKSLRKKSEVTLLAEEEFLGVYDFGEKTAQNLLLFTERSLYFKQPLQQSQFLYSDVKEVSVSHTEVLSCVEVELKTGEKVNIDFRLLGKLKEREGENLCYFLKCMKDNCGE